MRLIGERRLWATLISSSIPFLFPGTIKPQLYNAATFFSTRNSSWIFHGLFRLSLALNIAPPPTHDKGPRSPTRIQIFKMISKKYPPAGPCMVCKLLVGWPREHKDRVGEGRALYNLGNVYHAKGKVVLLCFFYLYLYLYFYVLYLYYFYLCLMYLYLLYFLLLYLWYFLFLYLWYFLFLYLL